MLVAILLLSAMVVFAGTAAAENIKFYGNVTYTNGDPYDGTVEITKYAFGMWRSMGTCDTDPSTGAYMIGYTFVWYEQRNDTYRVYIDGVMVEETLIDYDDWQYDGWCWVRHFSYEWDHQMEIPEFATIAIPAIALLGLFAFHRRKQKK